MSTRRNDRDAAGEVRADGARGVRLAIPACSRLVLVLFLALACGASFGQGRLGPITFAEDEEDADPVGVADRFEAGIAIVYAFFAFEDLAPTDVVGGTWYRDDDVLLVQAYTIVQVLGRHAATGNLFFSLRLPDGAPRGSYRLETALNGEAQQAATFIVETASTASAPTFDLPGLSEGYRADGSISAPHAHPEGVTSLQLLVAYQGMAPATHWGWRVSRFGTVLAEGRDLVWKGAADGVDLIPLDVDWRPGVYDLELYLEGALAAVDSVVVGDGAPVDLELLHRDDFGDATSGWGTAKSERGRADYGGGGFVIELLVAEAPAWSVHHRVFGDAMIEVDATTIAGPDDNAYGVIVRFQDEGNFHALLASADGYYAAVRFVDGQVHWDHPWRRDEMFGPIRLGSATNRLRVLAAGPTLRFYVNGRARLVVADAGWAEGQAGLFAAALGEPGVRVEFHDWRVWAIDEAADAGAPRD